MNSFLLILTMATAVSVDPAPPAGGDLDGLIAYALVHHPGLQAAAAGHEAAESRARQVGSLPDPVFMWGEMIEPVETRVGPQQRVLSLQQPIPWPGTLGARADAAGSLADVAAAGERVAAVRITAEVRRVWARAAWLAESREVIQRQLVLVRSLEIAARASYEAGQGGYGDLLQAQVAMARLADRLRSLDDDTVAARARLNVALGRDPSALLTLPSRLPEASPVVLTDTVTVHPRLTALDHRAISARHEATAARRAGMPGFTLGVDWIQVGDARVDGVPDSGKDAVVAKVGVSLPLWRGKHDGAADAAEATARAVQADRRAQEQILAAQTTVAEVALRDAQRRRDLHLNELLPRARQAHDTVLAAYRAEGAGFAEVLVAQRTLLELENSLLAARRDLLVAEADLDEAAGVAPLAEKQR